MAVKVIRGFESHPAAFSIRRDGHRSVSSFGRAEERSDVPIVVT
jgi:hypothetical protein